MSTSLIGKVLGKYRIVEKLGSGGIADVYKGIQIGLDRDVAIKVLPAAFATDRETVKRFRRESQATARLSHPHVITIYDSGEQEGFHFYVMEFLRSDSLADVLERERPLPLARALKIGQDILKALVYCHEKEVAHRNLEAGHVKFDLRENAILTDFGQDGEGDVKSDVVQAAAILKQMVEGGDSGDLGPVVAREHASAKEMLAELKKVELKLKAKKLSKQTVAVSRSMASQAPEPASSVGAGSGSVSASASLSAILSSPADREGLLRLVAITLPVFLLGLTAVLWAFGILGPSAVPALVEKAAEVDATRASLAWKTSVPCYSQVEYWPASAARNRMRTQRAASQSEHRHALPDLRPDTGYQYRFLFSHVAAEDGATYASEVYELSTRPEIQVFNIHVDEYAERVVITWETNLRTDTAVKFGRTDQYEDTRSNGEQRSETIHSITLEGLEADTTYHYQIVATDPRGRGQPRLTEDMQLRTSRVEAEPDPGGNRGLVNLTRSYVDKLTRMTPDERQKLKDSIGKFTDLGRPLGATEKKELLARPTSPTADGEFATRLQMTRRWIADQALAGRSAARWSIKPVPLESLFHVNRLKAAKQLDRLVAELNAAERG